MYFTVILRAILIESRYRKRMIKIDQNQLDLILQTKRLADQAKKISKKGWFYDL